MMEMDPEEADARVRSAIADAMGVPVVGSFVVAATVYGEDGHPKTVVHCPEEMMNTDQIALLMSALSRAVMVDVQGWMESRGGPDA